MKNTMTVATSPTVLNHIEQLIYWGMTPEVDNTNDDLVYVYYKDLSGKKHTILFAEHNGKVSMFHKI
jgi:hypothetical protein